MMFVVSNFPREGAGLWFEYSGRGGERGAMLAVVHAHEFQDEPLASGISVMAPGSVEAAAARMPSSTG